MVLASVATLLVVARRSRDESRLLLLLGGLTTGFITVQLIDKPALLAFATRADISLKVGAWLGLFGALLVLAAGLLALRGEASNNGTRRTF